MIAFVRYINFALGTDAKANGALEISRLRAAITQRRNAYAHCIEYSDLVIPAIFDKQLMRLYHLPTSQNACAPSSLYSPSFRLRDIETPRNYRSVRA